MKIVRQVGKPSKGLFVETTDRVGISRAGGGLVHIELDEVRELVEVLSQAAADLGASIEPRVDDPWDTFEENLY